MVAYAATTQDITVTVRPVYLDGQSDALEGRFAFGYFIRIANEGREEVQLLRRRWKIREAGGRCYRVDGEGVIGQQPVIAAGAAYAYNSFCVITSFDGHMEGTYLMQRPNGARFRVAIPRFHLHAAAN